MFTRQFHLKNVNKQIKQGYCSEELRLTIS